MMYVLVAVLVSAPPQALDIPDVVVTPGRRAQPALETARTVQTIGSEELVRAPGSSLPDLLETTPGVFLQRTNLGAGAPILRGLIGPQTLTLFDGVRLTTSVTRAGPNQYVHLIDPSSLQRVEIVAGPSAVLHGNGAMGGVVHAVSLDPAAEPYWGRAQLRFHTADLGGGGSLYGSGRFGDVGLVGGGGFEVDGPLRLGGGDEAPLSELKAGGGLFKVVWEPTPGLDLRGTYYGQVIDDAGRVDDSGKGDVRLYDNVDHLAYLRARWSGDVIRSLSATLAYHRTEERVARAGCETTAIDEKTKVVTDLERCQALDPSVITKRTETEDLVDTIGGDLGLDLSFWGDRAVVQLGAEFYGDLVSSSQRSQSKEDAGEFAPFKDAARGSFSDGSKYLSFGAFAHSELVAYRLAPDDMELRVGGGLRVSSFSATAPDVPELGEVSYDHTGVVGAAEVQLVWPGRLNLYGTYLQGFRAPNLQETTVLGDTGTKFEIPNPDLEPERSDTFELGAKVQIERVSLTVAWFYSLLDGTITEEAASYEGAETAGEGQKPVSRRVNAESGHFQGIETAIRAELWRFTVAYSMSWIEGEIEMADGKKVPPRRLPPVFGSASVRYTDKTWKAYFELGVDFAGAQTELNPGDEKDPRICQTAPYSGLLQKDCTGTPGWASLNARVGWQFLPNLRADLAVTNLLDANFRRHGSGYDAAGVDARASLTAEF